MKTVLAVVAVVVIIGLFVWFDSRLFRFELGMSNRKPVAGDRLQDRNGKDGETLQAKDGQIVWTESKPRILKEPVTSEQEPVLKPGDWFRYKSEGYPWYGPVMFVGKDSSGYWFQYDEFSGGNPWLSNTPNPKIEKTEPAPSAKRDYYTHIRNCPQCQDHSKPPCATGSKLSRDALYPPGTIIQLENKPVTLPKSSDLITDPSK